ncbi:MAG: hypothetical protein Q8M15_10790 [Bacteroidota bacterium]|nr:hypothetical protein [Bacteroidota bacterium]
MKNLSHNIKFNYLYRDAGNYKIFGSVIFENPDNISLSEIETNIKQCLIYREFFDPIKLNIPQLAFAEIDEEVDHNWNEFQSIELTLESITDKRAINYFLKEMELFQNNLKQRQKIN